MLKRIPSRSSSKKATSRKSTRSSRSSRSNGSNMSLREALAARQNSKSRKNPSKGKMSLRQALAARSNGGVAARRGELSSEIADLSQKYRQKQRAFASNPSETNRRLVEYYRSMLKNAKDALKKMSSSMKSGTRKPAKKRKATSRKSTSRKSTAKKSTSRKTKSGVANTTASYKRLRKSGTKSKFTRAFNSAFKKAKRSGKSVASAQRSAIAAGKKAASARKNPSSAIKRSLAALKVNAKAAKAESRQNPRKKKATRKSSKRKSTARSSRKPRTTSAINVHARKSKQYKALRSAAKKTAFLKEYRVAFKKQDNKRGVTEAQAAARAALIANSKINSAARKRKNPVSATASTVSRMNPRKKTTRRKASKKKTTRKSSSKKTSMRASSLEAIAKKSSLYKRLKSAALKKKFVAHFKKVHAKIARKAKSAAQANARASMSAWGTVSKGNTRKNPCACRTNPRKKSSSRRKSSTKRARGQRLKRSMRKSAKQALSVAGIYTYKIEMKGKVHTIKVSKNSKEYKAAKKGGLSKVKMTKLRGKKNTPTSLNLRSVYKVVDGRPTKKDFQRAINAWAGAVDGGKVRGISKSMRSRTRMNPSSLRKHTVNAISNPMPQSMATRIHRHNESSGMHTAKLVGIGVGSAYGTAIASNFFSSLLHRDFALNVTPEDREKNSSKKMLAEALPPALFGIAGGIGLYQKYVKKSDVPDAWVAFSGGMVAGAIASAASRTIVKGMSKFIPGFRSVSEYGGDSITLKEVADAATTPAATTPAVDTAEGFLLNLQDKGHNMSNFAQRRNGLGLYTSVPVPSQMGAYVADVGNYVPQRSNPVDRVYGLGAEDHAERLYGIARADIVSGMHHRSNPAEIPDSGISPVGANTQMVPNLAPRIPDGMYNINASLKEDMELIEPLSNDELASEGLTNVYSNGEQLHIIRAVPDVARQIAESNFGNIIGPSRVVNGAVLVLASIFDTPQNPVLTDRLRLNRAPEVPKGASFPQAGGVFSRVAFSSHLPSVNNQASFQEFGVRVKQA